MDQSRNHESRAEVPVIAVSVCLTVAAIVVGLRLYTRLVIIKQLGMDDYAAVFSLLMSIGCGTAIATSVLHGSGRHVWTLSNDNLREYLRSFYISIVFYNGAITSTKACFLLQYYRVLAVNQRMRRIFFWSLIFIGAWCLSQLLVATFQCWPIQDFWSLGENPHCIPHNPFFEVNGSGHIVTDIAIFCLPLPALIQLRINRTQKIMLIGVFSLGFFTCAISVIRIQYLKISQDVTWDNVAPACWSIGETTMGLVCACLPTLRPLISKVIPGIGSNLSAGRSGGSYLKHASGADKSAVRNEFHSHRRESRLVQNSQDSAERLNKGGDLEMGGVGVGVGMEKKHTRGETSFYEERGDDSHSEDQATGTIPLGSGGAGDEKKSGGAAFGLRGVVVTEISGRPPVPVKDRTVPTKPAAARIQGIQVIRDVYQTESH